MIMLYKQYMSNSDNLHHKSVLNQSWVGISNTAAYWSLFTASLM